MSDIISQFENQIAELEAQFQNRLTATGNASLARDFSDITTLRKSVEILKRKANGSGARITLSKDTARENALPFNDDDIPRRRNPERRSSFNLTKAVKDVVSTFGDNEYFSITEVWEKVKAEHPNELPDDERKRSASATLSNLTKKGVIERVQKGEGGEPTIYRTAESSGKITNVRN